MPLSDLYRRRPEAHTCAACGAAVPTGSVFCPSCGVRVDDPDSQPLHIIDRVTGLFNDRFVRPVLEDELARAHRYGRAVGVLLIEPQPAAGGDPGPAATPGPQPASKQSAEADDGLLRLLAAAVAGALRDVDTPGVLSRRPPQLLCVLPDTDMSGTAHCATRVMTAVNESLAGIGRRASVGLVCVHHGSRLRAGAVIEAAGKSLRSGRPELLGR